jgi:hypothetical protein
VRLVNQRLELVGGAAAGGDAEEVGDVVAKGAVVGVLLQALRRSRTTLMNLMNGPARSRSRRAPVTTEENPSNPTPC